MPSKGRPRREYLGAPEVGLGLQTLLLLVAAEDLFLVAGRGKRADQKGRKGGEKWRKVTKWQKGPSAGEEDEGGREGRSGGGVRLL